MFEILRNVYSNRKYIWISFVTAIISFVVFYKLTVASVANNSLKIYIMMEGYNFTYFSLLSFFIISVLFGVYLSLILYKFNLVKSMNKKQGTSFGFFGFMGFLVGAFGAGCPTCGAVLFGLIGAPLALMYFPYSGMELRILSIVILFFAVYFTTKSLSKCECCKV